MCKESVSCAVTVQKQFRRAGILKFEKVLVNSSHFDHIKLSTIPNKRKTQQASIHPQSIVISMYS